MKRWIKTLAGIGLTTAYVTCAGCGGGEAPQAGTKSVAASDSAPEPSVQPPAPAASKPEPALAAAKPEAAPAVAAKEGKDGSGAERQAGAGQTTPATKPDGGSSGAEMPSIATSNQPASTGGAAPDQTSPAPAHPESSGSAAPAGSLSTQSPGQEGMPTGYPGMGNTGGMPAGYPGAAIPGSMPAGYPAPGTREACRPAIPRGGANAGWWSTRFDKPGGNARRLSRCRWAARRSGRLSRIPCSWRHANRLSGDGRRGRSCGNDDRRRCSGGNSSRPWRKRSKPELWAYRHPLARRRSPILPVCPQYQG